MSPGWSSGRGTTPSACSCTSWKRPWKSWRRRMRRTNVWEDARPKEETEKVTVTFCGHKVTFTATPFRDTEIKLPGGLKILVCPSTQYYSLHAVDVHMVDRTYESHAWQTLFTDMERDLTKCFKQLGKALGYTIES